MIVAAQERSGGTQSGVSYPIPCAIFAAASGCGLAPPINGLSAAGIADPATFLLPTCVLMQIVTSSDDGKVATIVP